MGDSSRSVGPAAVWSDRLIPWFCDSDTPPSPSQVDRFAHDKKEPMSAFFRRHCSFANMSMYGGAVWARCTMRCDWKDRCKGVYILLRRCCLTRKLHFIGCRQQCSSKTKLIPSAMSRESQNEKSPRRSFILRSCGGLYLDSCKPKTVKTLCAPHLAKDSVSMCVL